MKTIVFNYGRLSPFDEPNENIPSLVLKVNTRRIVWGEVGITTDGDLGNECYLQKIDGCFYYDGIWYSDIWFEDEVHANECEDFNPELAKIPKALVWVMNKHLEEQEDADITTAEKDSKIVDRIIKLAKRCDGETLQYILEQSGKDEQMLKQLLATNKDIADAETRLCFIKDDLAKINKFFDHVGLDVSENGYLRDKEGVWLGVYLDNIAMACNLSDDTPNSWIDKVLELKYNKK